MAAPSRATPAISAAPLIAPAEAPTTRSKQLVSPRRSSAAVIPADTTPAHAPALDHERDAVRVVAAARLAALPGTVAEHLRHRMSRIEHDRAM